MSKPGIDQLLIQSALDTDLRARLLETPDQVFQEFDLTEEQRDFLRCPDHRLLALLGAAFARQQDASEPAPGASPEAPRRETSPSVVIQAHTLPDLSLALTVVPCARIENGQPNGFAYAVWVSPLPEGADPASLPPPPGASLPGQPLTPLHVVVKISAIQLQDAAGRPQVGLSASLRQSSNIPGPPAPESAGTPELSAFGSDFGSDEVRAAVAAVRNAGREERYGRLVDLMRTLRREDP